MNTRQKIILKNREVEYQLCKSRRARRVRLAIYCDGNFVVTIPHYANVNFAERFIREKADWILKKLDIFRMSEFRPINPLFLPGSKREYQKQRAEAFRLVESRLDYFNQFYNFKFNKITIRNQKTRWGSCSRNGNLSFNYKIALAPEKFFNYIIVHELCHLKEFSHSKKFWELVSQTISDYKDILKEIKRS